MAFTAPCTAVCTIAIARTAGGVPILASITNWAVRTFQSTTASAWAEGAQASNAADNKAARGR